MIQCTRQHLRQRCEERGYLVDDATPCIVSAEGDNIVVDEHHPAYPKAGPGTGDTVAAGLSAIGITANQSLCGTELKSLLRDWLGIESSPTCSCNAMARQMDSLGPDWCEGEGMASILDVMRTEHAKRWQDGRTILPWTDAGARQLVLLACRRSRAKAAG